MLPSLGFLDGHDLSSFIYTYKASRAVNSSTAYIPRRKPPVSSFRCASSRPKEGSVMWSRIARAIRHLRWVSTTKPSSPSPPSFSPPSLSNGRLDTHRLPTPQRLASRPSVVNSPTSLKRALNDSTHKVRHTCVFHIR